jgi:hypothetical protein
VESQRTEILELLLSKSKLKQDIYFGTKKLFANFKRIMEQEVNYFRPKIEDERIRMQFIDKGDFESQVYIGSDALVFHMHTNVFLLPEEHPFWKLKYLKDNPDRGFFGVIYIYNFLAQSFLNNRSNDPGYLIGRIFVNNEGHYFVEGKGILGELFGKLEKKSIKDVDLVNIAHASFVFALEFDLLSPPYDMVSEISVFQMQQISESLNMQTGKRLGFKFEHEQKQTPFL